MPAPPPDGHKFVATLEIKGPKTSGQALDGFTEFKKRLNELLQQVGGTIVEVKVVKAE
jgi:hypothetical protein